MSGNNIVSGPMVPLDAVEAQFGFLEGKVLTVLDASFGDREQRKAAKDLVRSAFRSQRDYIAGRGPSGDGQTS